MFVCYYKNQMRKEATVVVTSDKATKQTVISRTREGIVTSQEQRHISREKVNTDDTCNFHTLSCFLKNQMYDRQSLKKLSFHLIPWSLFQFTLLSFSYPSLVMSFFFFISFSQLVLKNAISKLLKI